MTSHPIPSPPTQSSVTLSRLLCFWWILFIILQQGQRWILLPEAWSQEPPSSSTLLTTLLTGLQADIIVATVATGLMILLGSLLAALAGIPAPRQSSAPRDLRRQAGYKRAGLLIGSVLMSVLTIDMGYYYYAHTHLDFVFFEYLEDLLYPRTETAAASEALTISQALKQTQAEIMQVDKWATLVIAFFSIELLLAWGWWRCYRRIIAPRLASYTIQSPRAARFILIGCLALGLSGFNWFGPWGVQRANISSSVYYTLAQNPIWYAGEVWAGTVFFELTGGTASLETLMPFQDALERSRTLIDARATFPFSEYPLVRETSDHVGIHFPQPVNILLIFLEGLDRRYLGRVLDVNDPQAFKTPFIYSTIQYPPRESTTTSSPFIRVTPFLDRLRHDSFFFEHFFSNGDQTARALFATLCSYFPRRGAAVMKTRYTQEFLCLPEVLREAGYWTEMIVGQNRDRNYDHIGLFLANQGLHRLLDENDFPPTAERISLGISDNALFEFVIDRIRHLRTQPRPYFLTTLTVGTHHPYSYPIAHPDVRVLQAHEDQYVPALRVLDLALERFFETMRREGLLDRTIVFILGDHGRHEGIGGSDAAARGSHFLVPLYIWIDPSLAEALPTRTKHISTLASQVDLAPTILSMTNLMPRYTPFLGQDLSCTLVGDCWSGRVTFLSGAHDDAIGLVDQTAMWLYIFRRHAFFRTSVNGHHPERDITVSLDDLETFSPKEQLQQKYRDMLALYVSTNFILEERRVWPQQPSPMPVSRTPQPIVSAP